MKNIDVNNSVCNLCNRTIDLHHEVLPVKDTLVHHSCFTAQQYSKLINIAGGLINAIEDEEKLDTDQLREDLIDALEGIR